jgi:hypothetical protein
VITCTEKTPNPHGKISSPEDRYLWGLEARQLLGYLRLLLLDSKKNLTASQKSVWGTCLLHTKEIGKQIMVVVSTEQKLNIKKAVSRQEQKCSKRMKGKNEELSCYRTLRVSISLKKKWLWN